MMYKIKLLGKRIFDILLSPFTYFSATWYKFIMTKGIKFFPTSRAIFMKVGVLPIIDQYYYPMMNPKKHLHHSLRDDRPLPGVNLNDEVQLGLLQQFNYNAELMTFPYHSEGRPDKYYYNNGMCGPGDSEILYSLVRYFKPRRIIEIGSGNSTLMSLNAIAANKKEDQDYTCELTCIEPYEMPWLETVDVKLNRITVQKIELSYFQQLDENDILFIDSSHIIRPQGDVLYEFLQLLPSLKKGVLVHVHDIFTPKDYPDQWIYESLRMYNEQYLLEAILTNNSSFEILAALNYLHYNHQEQLFEKCPVLKENPDFEPRSMWLRKVK